MYNLQKFYFDTGVQRYMHNPPIPLAEGQEWSSNDVKVIPFYCENVPETAEFMYVCDTPELDKDNSSVIVREIYNSTLLSKYAYFKLKDDIR